MSPIAQRDKPWRTDIEWDYFILPADTRAGEFGMLADVIDTWRAKHDGGRPPTWRSFDLKDITGHWRMASVYDVLSTDPPVFRIRFWGSALTELQNGDRTGDIISGDTIYEQRARFEATSCDLDFYREICSGSVIGYAHGPIEAGKEFLGYVEEISLPLSDGNGMIDKLLFVMFEHAAQRIHY